MAKELCGRYINKENFVVNQFDAMVMYRLDARP